jgi:transcriptional regulator with PAS, ATPase and Fis domain/predicted hydrocarbon binding protein
MKADHLKLHELVGIKEGRLDLQGRRLVIHSMNAFALLRRDLLASAGEEITKRIFIRFGFYSGQADAAAMKRIFKWDNTEELLRAGTKIKALMGVAKAGIETLELDEKTGFFRMDLTWRDSAEAEEYLSEIGKAKEPICWILAGHASGYASYCLNKEIYFVETKCMATGGHFCRALGKDEKSWGEEIDKIRALYKVEDINGKITQLTRELHQKDRLLKNNLEKIEMLEKNAGDMFIEVHSPAFRKTLDLTYRVAPFDSSVLVTGETGTGKEVMARYLHRYSKRSTRPFVAINCGALPDTLLESELFGHKAGAFTGAVKDRAGLFEEAHKGTIFLDEIGDISPAMQMKLLRVLQEKEIMRLGENTTRKIDVRVIAATNRNLVKDVASGKFREDLLYRIRVIEIEVPPLRKRQEDILPLIRYFIKKYTVKLGLPALRLDSKCIDYLQNYPWPGNVRELENTIERAAVLAPHAVIQPEHLPLSVVHSAAATVHLDPRLVSLQQFETEHIKRVLELCGNNRTKAAKSLGISPATMWRKMKNIKSH